jgi:ankyrin repeat protein
MYHPDVNNSSDAETRILILFGANINATIGGYTALDIAVSENHSETVTALLNAGTQSGAERRRGIGGAVAGVVGGLALGTIAGFLLDDE